MQTSETGIAFLKSNEGFSAVPYSDNGHMAWGYGHDQTAAEAVPLCVSLAEADLLLREDLATRFEPIVSTHVPPDCTQGQFNALVDFCYNLGEGALETMLSHGWDKVPVQLPRWNRVNGAISPGLAARRHTELAMFQS